MASSSQAASPILILYASELGTAVDLAKEVTYTLIRRRFPVKCIEANRLNPFTSLPTYKTIIFVTSTTGQGEIPTNGKDFWRKLLVKRIPSDWLKDVEFTTFGCGDSTYVKYNAAARKIHSRFLQLGATQVVARGEGDEQHSEGIDGSFFPWLKMLVETLSAKCPLPGGLEPLPVDQLLEPEHFLTLASHLKVTYPVRDIMKDLHVPRPEARTFLIAENERITSKPHWQDVRSIVFSIPPKPIVRWAPGDTITLLPKNFPKEVEEFLACQGFTDIADHPLHFVRTANPAVESPLSEWHIQPLTLRTLLIHHLDINAIPRRAFFGMIANFTENQTHKERLLEFTKPEYLDELYDYTTRPRRSILEVLQEFSSVRIPINRLLDVIPVIRARAFSVASSNTGQAQGPFNGPIDLEIVVAVVKYKTIIKKTRQGLCTRWLASLKEGDPISVVFQSGTLVPGPFTELYEKPAVMIAPGTGIAPMRALLWERIFNNGHYLKNTLIFGCRGKNTDFLFQEDWEHLVSKDFLRLHTAFSRDQPTKRYVQHVILEQAAHLWARIFKEGAVVYVCGSSGNMPIAVREALVQVFQEKGEWEKEVAVAYLAQMEKEGRFRQETW
ncbi:riboflavin synthase domain-like protein [Choiromyces venosus 120613-1]|uniref:NADPH-dependent diflavin oxidoreductase 1 n=1 Tax=Choiromyces venosus 120613-1 TaxID=1336337 RepID=A0A3N4K475_9PEZI|nr:riboflavin synthase domain-like protein [Choiromyces venosus 120613-1]